MIRSPRLFARCFLLCAIPLAPLLTGCAQFETLQQAQELERRARVDRLEFYQKLSDAYFLIGYEYYTLMQEAEAAGREEDARNYEVKARMYNLFHKDARESADQLRRALLQDRPSEPREPIDLNQAATAPAPPPILQPQAQP